MGNFYQEPARKSSKHFSIYSLFFTFSILTTTLWGKYSDYSHLIGEKNELRQFTKYPCSDLTAHRFQGLGLLNRYPHCSSVWVDVCGGIFQPYNPYLRGSKLECRWSQSRRCYHGVPAVWLGGPGGSLGIFEQLVSSCPLRQFPSWNVRLVFCKILRQEWETQIFMDTLETQRLSCT